MMTPHETHTKEIRPWPALWALVIGFFMILIDTTIVSVANPSIQTGLSTTTDNVIWVTSAYLLTYAVPLLVTGRLGDRFGPKNIYLIGLVVFTLASLWCGLSNLLPGSGIANLIIARAVQGLGAGLMTPQTMAVITRTFPPEKRGTAMALWGATAGFATLVGPILGGLLVDVLGWEWIFFINVPIGVVAFVMAAMLVPRLETHSHSFDWLGVLLSAAGMFFLVFGLQESNTYNWNGWVWASVIAGIAFLALFVLWQALNRKEPLLPLTLFKDQNFSLANAAISAVGFAITAMFIPLIYFFQAVRGMTPLESALMGTPSAVLTMILAPIAGRLTDRVHPRYLVVPGVILVGLGMWLYSAMLSPSIAWGLLLVPSFVMGLGSAFMWGPIATTANRNLPLRAAGAGSGVFNTTRQVGAVIGSAALAALMTNRISTDIKAALPPGSKVAGGQLTTSNSTVLPAFLHDAFTQAMSETLILPASVILVAAVCALFFVKPHHLRAEQAQPVGQAGDQGSRPASARGQMETD
ncbi:DHA2 family efflux MFS transporter permease subunit [Sinomonas terrae]|uniref:DHA2 family efflux MFS transporter permease subunit n=1 Tax=Sinomonas terrae TaxID=2908838 RepID=A0ABS9TY40_9MICC|nr:DHA2 family efflux MFS transporter permease subunit [Sinomonas terrae]MCH6469372.1 DHA2 family efflux MFS transporter permease subunit [Sinomonas terrae]